jgi:hypothetical protein
MINCDQVTQAAGDFLERRLHWRRRLEVLLHIAMCRGCRTYIEQFRLTLLGLHALPQPVATPPSEDLLERFRRRARQGEKPPERL